MHSWITRFVTSVDNGYTWSRPKELVSFDPTPRGPGKNKIISLSNGAWLAGISIEGIRNWDDYTDYSPKQGLTWEKSRLVPVTHKIGSSIENRNLWEGLKQESLWENDLAKVSRWDGIIQ